MSSNILKLVCGGLVIYASITVGIYATKSVITSSPTASKKMKQSSAFGLLFAAVGNKITNKYVLIDQEGNNFEVNKWFDKPLIISYIFTKCPAVCPTITASLLAFSERNAEVFGDRYRVISIGFDHDNDTPAAMKRFGEQYTKSFTNWKFLSGDPALVKSLSKKIGVTFKKNQDGEWLHTFGVTLIAPDGVVFEQILGQDYSDRQILVPLEKMEQGRNSRS
ncbi:MAG TPA: SCO family protein [Nitrospinota bacterium]|nr:SCO family protein [Nitrospinota bacterium]|tara:strand:+ start:3762 stop:4424 length:663 start_codon:yes stop_codon:yes gene_type:complete